MHIKEFIEKSKWKKPTPWAEAHNISPAIMTRLFQGKFISSRNYQKISEATGGKVKVHELMDLVKN